MDDALPSDSNNREDLLLMLHNKYKEAQVYADAVNLGSRRDWRIPSALRSQAASHATRPVKRNETISFII